MIEAPERKSSAEKMTLHSVMIVPQRTNSDEPSRCC